MMTYPIRIAFLALTTAFALANATYSEDKKELKMPALDAKEWKDFKVEGKGEAAKADATVTIHYTGWTTDGKVFDSSVTRGEQRCEDFGRMPGDVGARRSRSRWHRLFRRRAGRVGVRRLPFATAFVPDVGRTCGHRLADVARTGRAFGPETDRPLLASPVVRSGRGRGQTAEPRSIDLASGIERIGNPPSHDRYRW